MNILDIYICIGAMWGVLFCCYCAIELFTGKADKNLNAVSRFYRQEELDYFNVLTPAEKCILLLFGYIPAVIVHTVFWPASVWYFFIRRVSGL